ncbi:D-ribose pyranase [Plantactinospora sp. GCM10030261]|uniref:D-ribose pyranase n=1 Tax=Plantactinospora sp. GCM10030261 TaxID=3273420 RepID=UPI00360ED34E
MLRDHQILNPALLHALAGLGHTDVLVIADAGLPVPVGVRLIDLSLTPGVPSLSEVTRAVLASLPVERVVVATQSADSPVADALDRLCAGLPVRTVDHSDFKSLTHSARVIIRTGECTPYANLALIAGVTF